jgi:hypothetical protein
MTYRQLATQGGLTLVALLAAYFTWQRGVVLAPGEVVVVDVGRADLTSVRYDDLDKSTWVTLTRSRDQAGDFVAVRLSPQEKPAAAKDARPSKTPERLVRGSDAADKLFGMLAPLRAARSLGVLDQSKLKELGLADAKKRITLQLRDGKRSFTIAPAPPGGMEPYLRDEGDGRVYVVARTLLTDFQAAASILVERRVHGFRLEEADHLTITRDGKRREFVVSRGDTGVRIAAASTPDKPDTTLKTWHDRVFSLWPVEVLGKNEEPADGVPQVQLRVDYSVRGRSLGFIEIAKVAALASGTDAGKDQLYARSERTLGWIKLGMDAGSLLTDAASALR